MNKNIVVNGASRGIGKEITLQLAQNPLYNVYALGRNVDAMHAAFSAYPNVKVLPFDLEMEMEGQMGILSEVQEIHVLINNAGLLIKNTFSSLTQKDFERSMRVNFFAQVALIQKLLPSIVKGKGHVVNISSMGAFQGSMKFPELTAYASSKAAIANFTEVFAEEYKDQEIWMNCLCLGAVQTEMLEEAFPGYQAPIDAKGMAAFIVDFALNRFPFFNGKIIPVSTSTP